MYDELKYKQINRRVGIYKDAILTATIEIQNNHVKMSFKKLYNNSVKESLKKFNLLSCEDKIALIDNGSCDSEMDFTDLITDKIKEIILSNKEEEFYEEEESAYNVNLYTGEAMPIIIWMCSFANKRLDRSIADVAPAIVNKLLEFQEVSLTSENLNCTDDEYYIYVGDSEKFKFCVGKQVVSNFENKSNKSKQLLIEFDGKGASPKKPCRFWCLEKNLIKIKL